MKYLYYPLMILLLLLTVTEFLPILGYALGHLGRYQWMLYGMATYFILQRFTFFNQNEEWMQTYSHEWTHAVVGLMFFHKIHSLQAGEREGVVYHSGRKFGNFFIALAPYCLPIFTYLFLLLRIIGANKMLYIFDLFIGFTLAFHIVCFCKQTRVSQPDIQGQGLVRSLLFITVAWFFNASVILWSIRKGIVNAVTDIFSNYWDNIVGCWQAIF